MPGPVAEFALSATPGDWWFRRAAPDPALAGLVDEYWEVEGALSPFREQVLPHGRVELMVNLGPPHEVLAGAGSGTWRDGWYSGLHERAIAIESREGTHLVSARLHPLGAWRLLGPAVARCANAIVSLDALLGGDGLALRSAVRAAGAVGARFAALEAFLLARAQGAPAPPPFVEHAVRTLESTHGAARVTTLHEGTTVGRKHLAVSFTRHVGIPAKAYAKLQRFVWAHARLQERESVDWSTLATEAGYSDQSHLIRDFRRVGAASPREYLRRATPDGRALLDEER